MLDLRVYGSVNGFGRVAVNFTCADHNKLLDKAKKKEEQSFHVTSNVAGITGHGNMVVGEFEYASQ